jgi:hypothetical protein
MSGEHDEKACVNCGEDRTGEATDLHPDYSPTNTECLTVACSHCGAPPGEGCRNEREPGKMMAPPPLPPDAAIHVGRCHDWWRARKAQRSSDDPPVVQINVPAVAPLLRGDHVHQCPECYEKVPCAEVCSLEYGLFAEGETPCGSYAVCDGCEAKKRSETATAKPTERRFVTSAREFFEEHWDTYHGHPIEPLADLLAEVFEDGIQIGAASPCGHEEESPRRPTATASEPPFVTLSDRLVASMAKFADDHALPLTLKSQKGQTAIVLDDNGICVLDTTTPDRPCDFDCMVVDAVNCVSGLAREVQWHRANRGGERGWDPEAKRRLRLGIRVGDRIVTKNDERPGRLIDLYVDSGLAWAVVRLDEDTHEHGHLYDPELILPEPNKEADRG